VKSVDGLRCGREAFGRCLLVGRIGSDQFGE
jgi:hypothetical protein